MKTIPNDYLDAARIDGAGLFQTYRKVALPLCIPTLATLAVTTAASNAIGMGLAIGKSAEGISRQPEAAGNIRTSLMLGLVFIETVVIYALIIAILVIFVL